MTLKSTLRYNVGKHHINIQPGRPWKTWGVLVLRIFFYICTLYIVLYVPRHGYTNIGKNRYKVNRSEPLWLINIMHKTFLTTVCKKDWRTIS